MKKYHPIFVVRNASGQYLRADDSHAYGVKWTFDPTQATTFTSWLKAWHFAGNLPMNINRAIKDQIGDIWTRARALREEVYA